MDDDIRQAQRLLEEYRLTQSVQRPPSRLSRKPTEGVYTYKEVNQVLNHVISHHSNGTPGLIDALLSLGGDVNLSRRKSSKLWHVVRGKDQQHQRSDLLLRAATHSPADIVRCLARHADQDNLDDALHCAVVRGDLAVIKALLVHGADPTGLHDDFLDAVARDDLQLMEALLFGNKKPCLPCRSAGLLVAVTNQSGGTIRMLMEYGADVNYDGGAALVKAAEGSRVDLFAILLSGPVVASLDSLDAAVGRAYAGMNGEDSRAGREIIEMSLSAGARGPHTSDLFSRGFAEAVRQRQLRLLDTLLKFGKPSGHYETVAVLQAIESRDKDVLGKFLARNPAPTSLAMAVAQAMKIPDSNSRHETMQMLISGEAQGECIASAFVVTVQMIVSRRDRNSPDFNTDMSLFNLLLGDGKANVDYRNGEALQVAVRTPSMDVATQIVSRGPSPDTLGAALSAAMSLGRDEDKESMVELLMSQDVPEQAVTRSLIEVVQGGPENATLVRLLLPRANVNHNSGQVFVHSIRQLHTNTLQLLLGQNPNGISLFTAIDEALSLPRPSRPSVVGTLIPYLGREHLDHALKRAGLESYPDLGFMRVLLQAGADVTVDRGICTAQAARNLDIDALRLQAEFSGYNEEVFTAAFAALTGSGRQWMSFDHLDLIQLILSHGAAGQVVNAAMVMAIESLGGDNSPNALMEKLLDLFLAAGADVNYEKGRAVNLAVKQGNVGAVRRLLDHGATRETTTPAFSAAILAGHGEQCLLEIITAFTDGKGGTTYIDFDTPRPGMLPPLFSCLDVYPDSIPLVTKLLALGCKTEQAVVSQVDLAMPEDREDQATVNASGEEHVPVLLWALLQPDNKIKSEVINILIAHGANVSYATPKTGVTPLILAAKHGRTSVVQALLDCGAKPSNKDMFGRSALFFASRTGGAEIVPLLLQRNPVVNDGSLHEASRGFHVPIIQLLLKSGHEPNYRSTKHGGRTALGEMALKGTIPPDISLAEEAISVLATSGADPLAQVHGKSIIFLALENPHPIPMTSVLLDRLLWKTLNSDSNTYQSISNNHIHYSPTMYLLKAPLHPSRSSSRDLITLLRTHGAKDIYYSSDPSAPQPPSAVGLPPALALAEQTRLATQARIAQDQTLHQLSLQRTAEAASHRAALSETAHSTSLRHLGAAAEMQIAVADVMHAKSVHRTLDSAAARRQMDWTSHRDGLAMAWERAAVGAEIAVGNEGVRRGIEADRHRDGMAMTAERREGELAHRGRVHGAEMRERCEVERMEYGFREAREGQRGRFVDAEQGRRLGWLEREGAVVAGRRERMAGVDVRYRDAVGGVDVRRARAMGEVDAARQGLERERHGMRMVEMESRRRNMVGEVNLREWNAWKQGQGQVKGVQREMGRVKEIEG